MTSPCFVAEFVATLHVADDFRRVSSFPLCYLRKYEYRVVRQTHECLFTVSMWTYGMFFFFCIVSMPLETREVYFGLSGDT